MKACDFSRTWAFTRNWGSFGFFLLIIYSIVLFIFTVLFLWLVYISFFLCNILYLTDLLSFKEDFFPLNVTNSAVSKCPFT